MPAAVRLAQLRTNLVRLRSLSGNLGSRFVVCNIPAAQIEAIEDGVAVSRHTAVAGKPDRPSPDINSKIVEINFNPYWTVPVSIVRRDLIPKMQAEPDYLTNNHIRIFDMRGDELTPSQINWYSEEAVNYRFKQDPGDFNSLGSIRINFPSKDGVYMHDTPSKNLFGEDMRFHSSGCVRVQNVRELVNWLLSETPGWSRQEIDAVIKSGERKDAKVAKPGAAATGSMSPPGRRPTASRSSARTSTTATGSARWPRPSAARARAHKATTPLPPRLRCLIPRQRLFRAGSRQRAIGFLDRRVAIVARLPQHIAAAQFWPHLLGDQFEASLRRLPIGPVLREHEDAAEAAGDFKHVLDFRHRIVRRADDRAFVRHHPFRGIGEPARRGVGRRHDIVGIADPFFEAILHIPECLLAAFRKMDLHGKLPARAIGGMAVTAAGFFVDFPVGRMMLQRGVIDARQHQQPSAVPPRRLRARR